MVDRRYGMDWRERLAVRLLGLSEEDTWWESGVEAEDKSKTPQTGHQNTRIIHRVSHVHCGEK